jgi:hypothetical protein
MGAFLPGMGIAMTEPVAEPTQTEPVAPDVAKDWEAEAKKWKETSLKIEQRANAAAARAKANEAAASKLKEIEDRDLSELQRAQKAAQDASQQLAELQRQNTMLAKGIPQDLIPPVDASAEQLGEYADRLLAWRGSAAAPPVPQPKPDQGQGARPLDVKVAEDAEYAAYENAAGWAAPNTR